MLSSLNFIKLWRGYKHLVDSGQVFDGFLLLQDLVLPLFQVGLQVHLPSSCQRKQRERERERERETLTQTKRRSQIERRSQTSTGRASPRTQRVQERNGKPYLFQDFSEILLNEKKKKREKSPVKTFTQASFSRGQRPRKLIMACQIKY